MEEGMCLLLQELHTPQCRLTLVLVLVLLLLPYVVFRYCYSAAATGASALPLDDSTVEMLATKLCSFTASRCDSVRSSMSRMEARSLLSWGNLVTSATALTNA